VVGERERVVPGRGGDHAFALLALVQLQQRIAGAALLEAPCGREDETVSLGETRGLGAARAARSAGSVVCGRTCELFVLCLEPYAHPRHIGQSLIRWESLSSNILEIAGARPFEAARASAAATAAPRLYAIWGIDKGETKLQHQLTGTRAAGTPQAALRPKALRPNAPRRPTLPAVSPLPGGVSDAPGSSHTRSGTPSP